MNFNIKTDCTAECLNKDQAVAQCVQKARTEATSKCKHTLVLKGGTCVTIEGLTKDDKCSTWQITCISIWSCNG